MKGYGLLIAAIILAALSGVWWWSEHHKPSDSDVKIAADAPPKILDLKLDNISKIAIKKKGTDSVELARDNSGAWQIVSPKQYRADQRAASGLVSSVATLTSERLLDANATNISQYGLADASLEVDVTEKNNTTHKLLIGYEAPAGNNSYAALGGDPRVFTIGSYSKTSLSKSLDDLRDKRLLVFDSDKLSRVELSAKKQDIEFGRNKDQWQIVKPKPLRADDSKVEELIRKLGDAKMDLPVSADDQKKAAVAFSSGTPVATAKVTDAFGTQELQLRKNKDDYYAKSSVAEGIFKVAGDVGTALDKNVDDFRHKKLFDIGFADPDKIEMHDAGKSYFVTKGGQDWFSADGKKLDAIGAEGFIEKVRNLTANKFVDSGFGAPSIELTVTSNSGKTIEKVSIAKDGERYVARRDGESSLYELEPGVVNDLEKFAADLKPAVEPKPEPAKKK